MTRTDSDFKAVFTPVSSSLLQDHSEVLRIASGDVEIAAGQSAGNDERSRFNAVGDDAMPRAVKFADALDPNGRSSGTLDFCAHGVEQRSQIGDFGLAGAVLHYGFALGERGRHQ